jgi:23S rRNA (cytosine1962-C5)-methyltransferase
MRVLNLFAYTGGSTLACAAAGAEVTHVDAARNVVAWARRNAELSGLADAQIRWIGEEALKFARREAKRGSRYDAVILDPPSYGHGPRGEVWRLSRDLPRLLTLCSELCAGQCGFILLTCHTPGYDPPRLEAMVRDAFAPCSQSGFASRVMTLRTPTDRALPSGAVVRFKPERAGPQRTGP